MGISAHIISYLKKTRFVFNLQDIHPKVLFDTGAVKNRFLIRILSKMEKICYRNAHSFIVYSPGNRDYLLKQGVKQKIFTIPNWFDTKLISPSYQMNPFLNEKGIRNRFIVSYIGSMGTPQGLEIIINAANLLTMYDDIKFILAGEGPSKPILKSMINGMKLNNIVLLPMMLNERYAQFINAANVSLITLSSGVPIQTVPGKLSEIMACGKPLIAVVKEQGDAAAIIKQAECGFCVEPTNAKELSQIVLKLYRGKKLRKEIGKKAMIFAKQNFSRTICTKKYDEVLKNAGGNSDFYYDEAS